MVQRLVQKKHPYIFLRGNTYYFRFATPSHVQRLIPAFPKEVKRSLKTDSYAHAVFLVGQYQAWCRRQHWRLFQLLRCKA